jgi:NAD(P)-dependent dehydrogenase (short-subunit alcohol dehydrogenase family)
MARSVAIVTGAGSGIGAAIAVRLADSHDLILAHLHEDPELDNVLAAAERRGSATAVVTGDLTESSTVNALAREVERAGDRMEVLVSNAGDYPRIKWNALDLDTFRAQIEVNLTSHVACAQIVTPALTAHGHGRIIAVSSVLTHG